MQEYSVQSGDTLASLASRFGLRIEELAMLNNLSANAQLTPGQIIYIPMSDFEDDNMMDDQTNRPGRPDQPGRPPRPQPPRPQPPRPQPPRPQPPRPQPPRPQPPRPQPPRPQPPRPQPPQFPTFPQFPTPIEPNFPNQEYYCPILRPGSRGSVVVLLQSLLRAQNYYNGPEDGVFNARLQQSVRRFQQDNGIYASGVVDGRTWALLGVFCGTLPPISGDRPASTGTARGLRHVLSTNRRVYRLGQTVQIILNKTNVTNHPVSLRYNTSQIVEIVIRDMYGREVWRYSYNRSFNPFTRLITIMPAGTQSISENWNQTNDNRQLVMSGKYTITEQNLATGLTLSVQIEII